MNLMEYANNKIDRALRLSENFEDLNELQFKKIIDQLLHAIEMIPNNRPEKYELYSKLKNLMKMEIKRYGGIFKAYSWKDSMIFQKEDLQNLIWNVHSLTY